MSVVVVFLGLIGTLGLTLAARTSLRRRLAILEEFHRRNPWLEIQGACRSLEEDATRLVVGQEARSA